MITVSGRRTVHVAMGTMVIMVAIAAVLGGRRRMLTCQHEHQRTRHERRVMRDAFERMATAFDALHLLDTLPRPPWRNGPSDGNTKADT
jgi:hypothetical protein